MTHQRLAEKRGAKALKRRRKVAGIKIHQKQTISAVKNRMRRTFLEKLKKK